MATKPTPDEESELFLCCRYGDLEDIQQFVEKFGPEILSTVRDGNGNTVLHMVCGNGHADVLEYLLPIVEPSLLSAQNTAASTPLHWAALNSHLIPVQKLVEFPAGLGRDLIDMKNSIGRTPLGEAEIGGWEEGATWMTRMMNLDTGDDNKDGEAEDETDGVPLDIEVEIEDADGKLAKMTISASGQTVTHDAPSTSTS